MPLSRSADIARDVQLFHATDHHIPLIRGVPTIATIMDVIPLLHPEWIKQDLKRLKSWLFVNSIHRADHIITISEYSKQDMVTHLGIEPERISVTPLGVDPVYFQRVEDAEREAVLARHGLQPGFSCPSAPCNRARTCCGCSTPSSNCPPRCASSIR